MKPMLKPRANLDGTPAHSTIRNQLGENWHKLHPRICQRFATEPQLGQPVYYRGIMDSVTCSAAGRLFAHLTRIIGNPLTPFNGTNIRMDVKLFKRPRKSGVCWERCYYLPGKKPYHVTSVKRESHKGEMLECVGGGFGMVLKVSAEKQQLHFRSIRYFWQLANLRIPLPHIISPGATHVVHEQVAGKTFRFTITMRHPWLGRTFYQTGLFSEE